MSTLVKVERKIRRGFFKKVWKFWDVETASDLKPLFGFFMFFMAIALIGIYSLCVNG